MRRVVVLSSFDALVAFICAVVAFPMLAPQEMVQSLLVAVLLSLLVFVLLCHARLEPR